MSLQLDVKLLEGLSGKGQRVVKAKFRGEFQFPRQNSAFTNFVSEV